MDTPMTTKTTKTVCANVLRGDRKILEKCVAILVPDALSSEWAPRASGLRNP